MRLIARLKIKLRRLWRRIRARSAVSNPNYRGWALVQAADEARNADNRTDALHLYGRAIDAYLQEGQIGAAEIVCERLMAVEPKVVRTRCTLAMIAIGHEDVDAAIGRIDDYFSAVARSQGAPAALPSLLEMAAATDNPAVRRAIASAIRRAGQPRLAVGVEVGEAAPAEETSWSRAVAGALKRPDEVDVQDLRGTVVLEDGPHEDAP